MESPRGAFPAIDAYQQNGAILLMAEIPGVEPDSLNLTVLNGSVALKGCRKETDIRELQLPV